MVKLYQILLIIKEISPPSKLNTMKDKNIFTTKGVQEQKYNI